jgi:hypothetical protein
MSRYSLFFAFALWGNFVLGQDAAPAPVAVPAPAVNGIDVQQLKSLLNEAISPLSGSLASLDKRLTAIETEQAKGRQVNLNVCDGGFVTRRSEPPCDTPAGSMTNAPGQAANPQGMQGKANCQTPACQEAYVPAKRVYTTWVTSHKKVIIKQPTPYVAVSTEWDPVACCNRSVYVTKYRDEEREVLVPYKKEMICEEIGLEKIKVCLAD